MIDTRKIDKIGRLIWVSLFGRWMFALLVPWFVPTISYLLIGDSYFASFTNFILGSCMVLLMTTLAFVPHDWAARYFAVRYPSLNSSLKRGFYTAVAFWILTGVYVTVYGLIIIYYKPLNAHLDFEKMIHVYLFEFVAVIVLTCLYEGNYYLKKWKEIKVNKEAIRKAAMQGQLQSLKSQVNPHFLFNSLNTLSALITDEPKRAERFVDEMAQVYRYLLQNNQEGLTTVADELKFIRSYFHLLKTRYDQGVELLVNVNKEDLERFIPPLTLQLLVENAVKHNTILEENPLQIEISSTGDGLLQVSNNVLVKTTTAKSTKLGLANIYAKYTLLSDKQPVIDAGEHHFRVMLPLLNEKFEHQ